MSQYGKKLIINLAGTHLGFIISEDTWNKDVINIHFVEDFLEKENSLLLCALLEEENDNKRIRFADNISSLDKRHVVFFKNKQDVLSEENLLDSLTITSVQGSVTAALYHSLNRLFVPLISKNENKKSNNALIERQLATLQAGLRSSLLISDSIDDPINNEKIDSISVVLSVDHEVEYWHNVANTSKSREHIKYSTSFRDILMPLAKNLSILDALPMNDVEDTLESAHNILDDLWRHEPPYPKARTEHLMEIIANDILNYITKQIKKFDIWKEDYNTVIDLLEQSSSVGDRWISSCRELTEIFWPNYSLHTWTSSPYVPINLTDLMKRLKEIISIRAVHKQLIKLLSNSEQEELTTNDLFKTFQDVDCLQYGRFNEQSWITATKQYEYLLAPVEKKVALKLKSQFSSINANTRQLLYEFGRYSNLISRPILKTTLSTERQYLLNLLHDYVKELSSQTTDTPILSSKYDTPQVVAEILHTRTLQAKVTDINNISQTLLNDLNGYEELNQNVGQLTKELKNQNLDLYDSWTSEIITRIKDKTLSLSESDPVVRFSANKLMEVNYSPRLVSLISEVRQFSALGYNVPAIIIKTSEHARQFMNYAKYLEQISNFHNTIGDRMITSQRPMMLAGALELARLVQEQEVVSWGNLSAVEKYVDSLKTAVDKLSNDNNLLTTYHLTILEKINELNNVDLLKHYDKWKSSTKSMRDIVNQVQQKGFKSSQQWKVDLDKHLSKVLEMQYSKSLDKVHLYLPEIYTELIYRDHELLFSPDEKNLREKYDQQMKRFVDTPVTFRGISDNAEGNMFSSIPERCREKLLKLTSNTDDLFQELQGVKKHWKSWLTLDVLDTTKLTTWQHWDLHFRSSKTFGQEIAKLPSVEERIGCFVISLSRLRSDLESHNRSYWDKLVESLKSSILQHVLKLQEYVDVSTGTLNKQPLTIEQIGEADASHSIILTQKSEMDLEHQEMVQKAHVLASWTRERIDAVNRLQGGWERLQNLLENYEHIISKQVETVKTSLQISSKNLYLEMERFAAKWEQIRPKFEAGQIGSESIDQLQKHLENVKEKKEQWIELKDSRDKILMDYKKFNIEPDISFDICEKVEKELNSEESIWSLFDDFYQDLQKLMQEEWIIFRKKIYKFEDFLINWKEKLQKFENTPLITKLLQEIHKYQEIFPSLKYLKGEDFTEKHWIEVFAILNISSKPLDVISLRDFLSADEYLISKKRELEGICKKAASEIVVRQALSELDQWDVQAQFELNDHNDVRSKPVKLIKNFKDVLNKIGDNQSLLQSVKNSSDFESFSERAFMWENRLNDLDKNITSLMFIQRKWIYLEPIFMGGTLGQEKNRFDKVDKDIRHILSFVEKDARVCALVRYSNLRSVLSNLTDQLGRCQNSLDEFLSEKRNKFPRFLFLGDDDLLEIVGQSSKEQVIQTHLKKLFAGINSILMDGEGKNIIAMKSLQGEVVQLTSPIDINQPIEDWLNNLVKEMQISIKGLLIQCMADGNSSDPLKYPSQILCLAENINFTSKCEQAISSTSLSQLLATYKSQLAHYSTFDINDGKKTSLTIVEDEEVNILDIKLKALLLDTIYYINVIEDLLESNVNKTTDWKWQRQLRFYSNSSGQVTIKMVNARIEYAYEYIGNVQKLVRTALTDKCFLTLTQAMHLGLGGNPYGPAGTGKTESVKSLGSLLGRQVLVFNCDEGIDAASMGRILSGLVRCGAWGCFDEFNRLDEATLSAITMYIQPIQNALKTQKSTVSLLDQEIQVNKHCGIFVTLNPASGDYGGRNKLPDNLKQLFRPVIMSHPDHEDIGRTLLYCDGYRHADVIGKKLVVMFSLASKLLSKQHHYDWGLRALRTVLGGCGKNMKETLKNTSYTNINQELEFAMVVRAVKKDTLSKLTFVDCKIFTNLLGNIFPVADTGDLSDNELIALMEESQIELGLEENNRQISKCLELYEQLGQRMGVSVVGPPMSGKTTIRNILFHALRKSGKNIKQYTLNPKAITRNQLLGQIDSDSRQWTDGVLTQYSLNAVNEPPDVWTCIVCDGDIDPEWVESLNSVLDDNRIMTLPSGWRIQFGLNVNFIFETDNLNYASPATISRMGITFLSEEDIELKSYVIKFLKTLPKDTEKLVSSYVNDYLYKAIEWVSNDAEIVIRTPKIALTKTALSQMKNVQNKSEFIIGLLNGLGGQMDHDFRELFSQMVFEWVNENAPSAPLRSRYSKSRDMIESYFTSPNQNLEMVDNHIPLVLTSQIQQTIDSLKTWLEIKGEEHFLLVGPHGSAKRLIIEHIVKDRSDAELSVVHCSEYVQTQYVIQKILQYCVVINSNIGKIYKPRKGHLLLFFKNMHLLKEDKWGNNMLLSFLQQLIVYHGFFDNNLEWATIQNITIVGTLNATNNLSKRFTSLMNVYNVELPQEEDLKIIYFNYLTCVLKKCGSNSTVWTKSAVGKLTTTILSVYNEVKETFLEINQQHYSFSPHDLTKWCEGLIRYKVVASDVETGLLELICHEALRIFYDFLNNEKDKQAFLNILKNKMLNDWSKGKIVTTVLENYYIASTQSGFKKEFTTLMKLNSEDWKTIVRKGISQYEREGVKMDVEIIPELLYLTSTLSRALTSSHGNCLIVGNAGIGRHSAVRIITALQTAKLIIPASNQETTFKKDFKMALHYAGVEGEEVYFLIEDHVLSKTEVLNAINIFISSGEYPTLYNAPELETLLASLKDEAGRINYDGNLYDFFVERARKKLHIIICLEQENESISKTLKSCPSFFQDTCVIWINEWSKSSEDYISKQVIQRTNEKNNKDLIIEEPINLARIQDFVDSKLATPMRFVMLIKTYIKIYEEKKETIMGKRKKLEAGVLKLTEARQVVADLKLKAAEQQIQLSEKQTKANKALDMISNTMKNANVHKEEMESLKKQTEKENLQIIKRKQEIEVELSEVEPLIQEARNAVGNIKTESLSEIRSLRAPPEVIRDILEGVLRLMGIQDTSWNSMKIFLAKRGIKEDIRSFNASRISTESRQAVEKLLQNKKDSFDPKSSKRASVAAAPLAAWVLANVRYSKVLEKIKPLEREQNRLEENLTEAESQLSELSAGLLDVDATVAKLKNQLSTYTREAAEIEISLSSAQGTLASAEGLVEKLNDEYKRWQIQLKELEFSLTKLSAFSLLSAAFITYLSQESEDVRLTIMEKWKQFLSYEFEFSLEEFLSSEREQLQWQSEGLSTDKLSIQNAIIILKTNLCPLLIDPTSMAVEWIKKRYQNKNFDVTTTDSAKFNNNLELAVRFGKILLIEEVEQVPSCLFSILRKQFVYQGERVLVSLNGKLIDYNKDFCLILSSRNAHFQLTADVNAVVSIINFTTTRAGLSQQLLISAVRQENPELEKRRKDLLKQSEDYNEKQYVLQNQLLEDLVNSSGDILQNKNLLQSLNETKASSSAISKALNESLEIQAKLQEEFNVYKDISQFGSDLYFAISEFSNTNIIYSISVSSYIILFLRSLPSLEGSQNSQYYTQKTLIQAVYQSIGKGIFKSDRLQLLMYLLYRMFPEHVPKEEWDFFIGNLITSSRPESSLDRKSVLWLSEQTVNHITILQTSLPKLYDNLMITDENLWKDFMQNSKCESSFPSHCKLSEFQKLIIVQILRSDRLYSAMCACVRQLTGIKSLHLEVIQLSQIYKESYCQQPILLLSTSGNDPSMEIKELCNNLNNSDKYIEVCMGEGQETKAISNLLDSANLGNWLVLKNLHLVTSWLPILCQELRNLKPNQNFRLWLITEAHQKFNSVLAENSLKIAFEPPAGIKSNIFKTFTFYGKEYLEKLNSSAARIFFAISCIHAIFQERRNFIPQGWSKWYEFSDTDLTTLIKLSEEIWQVQGSQISWKYIKGWSLEAIYGGRIENNQDLIILKSYLEQYFNDEVLSHRWKPLGLSNHLPSTSNYKDYLNTISQLSNKDIPSYFGLSENIERAWERNFSTHITKCLKDMVLLKNMNTKLNKEVWYKNLSPFLSLWKKLNHGHDFTRVMIPVQNLTGTPIQIFISEEFRSALVLIQKIHKNFAMLNKIAKGYLGYGEEFLEIATSLFGLKTPSCWLKLWNGPKEPIKFLKDVINKSANISNWANDSDTFHKKALNLSLLFNPDTYLAACKQNFAKENNIALDDLEVVTSWKDVRNSIILKNLLLEGAIFDGLSLAPCTSQSDSICSAGECYITWQTSKNIVDNDRYLEVPLYYSSLREEEIMKLQVPCNHKEKSKWVQTGIAFFLTY